ncbi:MAG: hypothetical protein UR60_C0002G0007 [Candidatus Moranbacteria bacterium GW2011_GWF2_34_56]|nr:MAG: hypothetical protein UR60_C0002G0007 [Candidatus Moranbacteria bacterium GW2011_GWF2_34_56]HBI17453.1 hypothetical protein [Candidatus Moranbacteria bacterium]
MNVSQRVDQYVHRKGEEWLEVFFPSKNRERLEMTRSYIVKNNAVGFLREIWDNKILSLFYLIVIGANTFEFSKEVLGVQIVWQRLIIATSAPITIFIGLVFLVVFILEKFKDNKIILVIKEATREFFQIFEDDSHEDVVETVRMTMKQRAYYVAMDYWVVFACIGLVATLNYFNKSDLEVSVWTIAFDFWVAWGFMVYSLRTGKDVTFGEGYRRALDIIHRESKVIGFLGMVAINAKATIWDGPEQVPIFFKKELGDFERMVHVLVPLSIIQGIFWAWLYSYGYESVFAAVKSAM